MFTTMSYGQLSCRAQLCSKGKVNQKYLYYFVIYNISRTINFEYGDPDWKFAIKLIYKNMVQEKK